MSLSDTDNSEEEENLKVLQEAADEQFINDSMFKNHQTNGNNIQSTIKNPPPSLRRSKEEDEQFNLFRVTPEFRKYIAKHLTKILDEVLAKKLTNSTPSKCNQAKKRKKSGIKLFKNSPRIIKLNKSNKNLSLTNNKRPIAASSDNNEEKCKLIAVTPEDILSKKEIKSWSNRSKAPIFRYQKTKSGLLIEKT